MSDPRMIPADEAKALLDATGLRGCDLEHFASYDPEERYPSGARSLVYIDGWEDVDGLGNYQETGGSICDGVPEEVAPLFAAAPDLAHTVVEQAAQIEQLDTELRARAADTLEYRVEHQHIENGVWHPHTQWSPEWPLNDGYSVAPDERIVCRRVSHPWEVTDG